MIFDRLGNAALYSGAHQGFSEAFAFLERAAKEDLPVGRYELDGEALFAMVQEYDTNPDRENSFEGHLKYIDIQFVVRGEEAFEAVDRSVAVPACDYSEEKDVCFYADRAPELAAILGEATFAIFFPHDIHKPGLAVQNKAEHVKKIVVKVKA